MNDELKPMIYIACGLFALMCGLALCIHVYGVHWANPELQRAMHGRAELSRSNGGGADREKKD